MGLEFDDAAGRRLPTATASRIKMQEDLPKAREVLKKVGASDLEEILFGEDAECPATSSQTTLGRVKTKL